MNYYGPRQRESDKRWDYTCRNDGHIWPVGYCRKYEEWWVRFEEQFGHRPNQDEIDRCIANQHKYHSEGHATDDEACACYREYLLDHHLRLGLECSDAQYKCKVCGAWTSLYAEVDMRHWTLCEQHNNREEVEKLFGKVGEIWSS